MQASILPAYYYSSIEIILLRQIFIVMIEK